MEKSLKSEGILRYVVDHLLPIAVPRDSIDIQKLATKSYTPENLPSLDSVWIGPKPVTIIACGGQHRQAALQRIYDEKEKEALKMQRAVDKALKAPVTTKVFMDPMKATQLMAMKKELKLMGMWGVCVFDLGE
jgi:hypothetical protein